MNFKPCLLIPIYNHWRSIGATVDRLAPYGLPIYIVDDGSDENTQATLAALAASEPLVRLDRLPQNGGKGAAVIRGLVRAYAEGCTHALQIDADGQHDTGDVPRFLALAKAEPSAVVCGKPIYDESVPKARHYGRYVSHFWVGVETLSLKIVDAMCGYRVYPLAETCALIDRVSLPKRMDFDIEILVRLAWQGLRFANVPTRVTYPPGGLSHFDLWRDNLRIARMHTRLFFAMPFHLPALLRRKLPERHNASGSWWRLGERGGSFALVGLRIIFACYRVLGPTLARALLYPVVAYFFATGASARRASLDYLARVNAKLGAAPPDWRQSYRHMQAFAQASLDKLAAWVGDIESGDVDFANHDEFERLVASGRGAVLIGSHLGNLEMVRALALNERHAVVNAVVYTDHAQRFNTLMREANADFNVNLIQVSQLGPDTAILLKDKIDRGELVVIVGDRTPPADGSGRVSAVDFLGDKAPFAQGPFVLASLLDCPVYLFFCLRDNGRYRVHFERFADRIELPRKGRLPALHAYMQQYARRLEHYCLSAPLQWFNFYDFWKHDASREKS